MRRQRKPRLRAKPVVAIKWRWKENGHLTHRGVRYFAFGILPIWTTRERVQ